MALTFARRRLTDRRLKPEGCRGMTVVPASPSFLRGLLGMAD